MKHYYKTMKSPVGELVLVANESKLVAILWENDKPNRVRIKEREKSLQHPVLLKAEKQLQEYFKGKRKSFDIPIEFYGTDFQKSVWSELAKIPFGKTLSYADIAERVFSPKACRAVGAANGRNPISIIIPCHRVIGKDGTLTGFAGGLGMKEKLLRLENAWS